MKEKQNLSKIRDEEMFFEIKQDDNESDDSAKDVNK